jgi:Type IV pili methyl-accepting chemotaxis transducer N-term
LKLRVGNLENQSFMKKTKLLFFALLSFQSIFAQVINDGTLLNIAAKQRMLIERMTKDYVFQTLGTYKEKAAKEQLTSSVLFEEQLKNLSNNAPNDKVKLRLEKVQKSWDEFKSVLGYQNIKTTTTYIFQESDKILTLCDDVVNEMVIHIISKKNSIANSSLKREIITTHTNMSGKMRMMSQRLCLYYVCYHYGITQNIHNEELLRTAGQINFNLNEISNSPINSKDVSDNIAIVKKEWELITQPFYKEEKFDFSSKSITPEVIFDITNRLVSKIDKVTLEYAKMLDN